MKKIKILYILFLALWGTTLLANFNADFYTPTEDFHLCYYKKLQNADNNVLTKDFFNSILQDCHSDNLNDISYSLQQCFYFDFLNRFTYYRKQTKDFNKAQTITANKALDTCSALINLYTETTKENSNLKLEEMMKYSVAMAFDFIIE